MNVLTRRLSLSLVAALGVCVVVGCEVDGWMGDPSVIGRWENTPTIVPILERIDIIERDEGDYVEVTQVTPDDLIPVVREYTASPGDVLRIEIFDFLRTGEPYVIERIVDSAGRIEIPQIGRLHVHGLSADEVRDVIGDEVVRAGISRERPLTVVTITSQREQTFSVFGSISGVGRYFIPSPNYRLLEALTEAGGVSPAIRKVQIIRQVPLSDEVRGMSDTPAQRPDRTRDRRPTEAEPDGRSLIDLIDELAEPSPGAMRGGYADGVAYAQPEQPTRPPPIDLVDSDPAPRPARDAPAEPAAGVGESRWVYLNGEWVRVTHRARGANGSGNGVPDGADPLAGTETGAALVTQRIIEVPTGPLLKGAAQYNVVIRPGDIINVPGPAQGVFYLGGPGINRPGVFNLPVFGRLTLKQAITAGGGLSAIGIPERVDLTRRIGDDREATIRLNLRAIFEGTQPDIFLKPDDHINVGTHFFATPMAVIRNGFRMSYGFGFLLDRNFGNDVFGAPPSNVGGGR